MASSNPIQEFMDVTGASKENAAKYMNDARGDVGAALSLYFEQQEAGEEAGTAGAAAAPAADAPPAGEGSASVDSIVKDAQSSKGKSKGAGGPSNAGGVAPSGKASGKGQPRTVAIVFFKDGFMVDEECELPEEAPKPEEPEPQAAVPRRTGMMGLNDLKKESRNRRGPLPKLPKLKELRSYDTPENKAFLDSVKAGRLPAELQKRDSDGNPIPTSLAVEDARSSTYEEVANAIKQIEQMHKGEEKESSGKKAQPASTLFSGVGQTLSSSTASPSSPATPIIDGSSSPGPAADPSLLAIVAAGPAPEADESKPCTTLQLRLASGARVKVRLNLDHTVADLWRVVAKEMGLDAFKASSQHALSAGFPPKVLTEPSKSLEQADLSNASVTHRCQ